MATFKLDEHDSFFLKVRDDRDSGRPQLPFNKEIEGCVAEGHVATTKAELHSLLKSILISKNPNAATWNLSDEVFVGEESCQIEEVGESLENIPLDGSQLIFQLNFRVISQEDMEIMFRQNRPVVPFSEAVSTIFPYLEEYDFFTALPSELFRKATDELALGLHWYILCTLLISKQLFFRQCRPMERDESGNVRQSNIEVKFKYEMAYSPFDMLSFMNEYHRHNSTYDIRALLNHIASLQNTASAKDFYCDGIEEKCRQLKQMITYNFHLNHIPNMYPGIDHVESYNFHEETQGATRRQWKVINFALNCMKELVEKLILTPTNRPRIVNNNSCWECVSQILRVANRQFDNMRRIRRLILSMFSTGDRVDSPLSAPEVLEFLKTNCTAEISNEGIVGLYHQQVLCILWTRFGFLQPGESEDTEDTREDNIIPTNSLKKNPYQSIVKVSRAMLRSTVDNNNPQYFDADDEFSVDPLGITNQDYLIRVLHATTLAIRHILINLASLEKKSSRKFDVILNCVRQWKASSILVPGISLAEVSSWEEVQMDKPVNLFEVFCSRHNLRAEDPSSLNYFLRFDPYWADARFIGEFVTSLKDKKQTSMFPLATQLIQVRDVASHQQTLFRSSVKTEQPLLTYISLWDNICILRQVVNDLMKLTPSTMVDIVARQAVMDMEKMYFVYRRWRGRWNTALDITTNLNYLMEVRLKVEQTLNGLMHLSSDTLVDFQDFIEDGTIKSAENWLQFLRPRVRDNNQTIVASASKNSNNNINNFFALLDIDEDDEDS